jgi:P-type Mg2+ transporter
MKAVVELSAANASHTADCEIDAEEFWKEPADRLLVRLVTTPAGLAVDEAEARSKKFGLNDAVTVKRSPLWVQFLSRFRKEALCHRSGSSRSTSAAEKIIRKL